MKKTILAVLMASSATVPAMSAHASGMLPLKHGIFVDERLSCRDFSQAYYTQLHTANKYGMGYWGGTLTDAFTVSKIVDVRRNGQSYDLKLDVSSESPMGSYKGPGDQTVVILNQTSFQTDIGFGPMTFRWCYNEIP